MPLESGTYISDLNASNPAHSDPLSQTDAHLRLLKAVILATFTAINGPVNITDEQLNALATGTHSIADGTATAPSLAFISEPTLGLYRSAAGVISISTGSKLTGNGAVPTGMLGDFLHGTVPTGWYELNGQAVSRTGATAGLFAIYGTTYGVGDGSTTFNLPNLNDRFRRSRGTWAVGTFQADAIKSHAVTVSVTGGNHQHTGTTDNGGVDHSHTYLTASGRQQDAGSNGNGWSTPDTTVNTGGASAYIHAHTFTTAFSGNLSLSASASYTGDTETRPMSAVVVTCVKA